jgi:hypothetical protein
MPDRIDETWHRLREWTYGQTQSERLAGQILIAEGYTGFDPSHPLGGPDSGHDGMATKDGQRLVMAVYFPRGQQSLNSTKAKFATDLEGVASNNADGIVFVTNQELTLSERRELGESTGSPVDLYHLERITAVLDQPPMRPTRNQFLGTYGDDIDAHVGAAISRLEGMQTGGNTFCYWMLYDFDMQASIAKQWVVIRRGEYPLYNVHIRISEAETRTDAVNEALGELNAPAIFRTLRWPLRDDLYYRVWFGARNGQWRQDLILKKSDQARCWLAATKIYGPQLEEWHVHVDNGFEGEFGPPTWRT